MAGSGGLFASLPSRAKAYLVVIVVVGFAVALAASATVFLSLPTADYRTMGLLVAIMFVSVAVKVPVRFGSHQHELQWLESGFIIGMLIMPGIAPTSAATALGVFLLSIAQRRPPAKVFFNTASLVLSVTVGGLVWSVMHGGSYGIATVYGITAMALAAAATVITSSGLVYGLMALILQQPLAKLVAKDLRMIVILYATNTAVAMIAGLVLEFSAYYLIGLPIVLWLVQQVHEARVNARTEREAWQNLAASVHRLKGLDVDDVVDAAIRGGTTLFSADAVEVVIYEVDDHPVTARGTAGGSIYRVRGQPASGDGSVISHQLTDGTGGSVGLFRLCFDGKVALKERERLTLAAFGDAVSAAVRDASAHCRLRSEAERKAHEAAHDPLTGLANRPRLMEVGRGTLADLVYGEAVALAVFGLDHFKDVTNTLGHAVGDQLLRHVADRIAAAVEPGETVARLGGDEFAVLLARQPDTRHAAACGIERTNRLHAALRVPTDVAGVPVTVEASVGVAVSEPGLEIEELLRRAHVAMHHAKTSSQPATLYAADRDGGGVEQLSMTTELRTAIERDDQLVLYLQPTIDLVSGEPLGAEALIRWQHPRNGLLAPGAFIPVVEKSELIKPFTLHVLGLALRALKGWPAGLDLPVSVNLSARCLLDRELPVDVAALLHHYDVPAHRLILEITETVVMSELEVVEEVLNGLRTLGVQLSVDDFGTGYSSLKFLARVPVHELKIDHSFVTQMHRSAEAEAIVRLTVDLARTLGLRVIAEGVETAEQQAKLLQLGCTGGQGLHLFAPTPAEKVGSALWVAANSAAEKGSATIIPLNPLRNQERGERGERGLEGRSVDGRAADQ